MNASTFPHHSGGVVQVQHVTRYGAVPEPLLEDSRLDLDSRAVAAWLAVKPHGWQISVNYLRQRLAPPRMAILGKDRWQRIANELESAGYLSRKKLNGKDGQWDWEITFNPVPTSCTVGGSAGYGAAESGASTDGSAGAGKHGHKELPFSEIPCRRTTTTKETSMPKPRQESEGRSGPDSSDSFQDLHYPKVTPGELAELKNLMLICPNDLRQQVLDEIEGIRKAGAIKRSAISLANGLVKKAKVGEFSLSSGYSVQEQREIRQQNELAISRAIKKADLPVSISEEGIAKVPRRLAERIREADARAVRSRRRE